MAKRDRQRLDGEGSARAGRLGRGGPAFRASPRTTESKLNLSGVALEASMEAVRRVGEFAASASTRRKGGTPELAMAADAGGGGSRRRASVR